MLAVVKRISAVKFEIIVVGASDPKNCRFYRRDKSSGSSLGLIKSYTGIATLMAVY